MRLGMKPPRRRTWGWGGGGGGGRGRVRGRASGRQGECKGRRHGDILPCMQTSRRAAARLCCAAREVRHLQALRRRPGCGGAPHLVGMVHVRLVAVIAPAVGAGDQQRPMGAHAAVVTILVVTLAAAAREGAAAGRGRGRRAAALAQQRGSERLCAGPPARGAGGARLLLRVCCRAEILIPYAVRRGRKTRCFACEARVCTSHHHHLHLRDLDHARTAINQAI
jgi:hypothetical protein